MSATAHDESSFEVIGDGRSRVLGMLDFASVTRLLPVGSAAIESDAAAIIDLAGVTGSDSSGLALLVEWLSVAQEAKRSLRFENMPAQLQQLARLSEVEDLVIST